MSDAAFRTNSHAFYTTGLRANWGAIWGGVFTFAAVWTVFEVLAVAIFPDRASVGMQTWTVILTIIAMYVAGRETGRLAGVDNRHGGMIHGLVMFGLSVVGVLLLLTIGGGVINGGTGVNEGVHNGYALTVVSGLGWAGFLSLFFGWLAAMIGASSGVVHKEIATGDVREIDREMRPAA